MNEFEADKFWERVDFLRNKKTLKALTKELGIEYETIRVQRTRHRFPKPEYMYLFSKALNTSIEYLLTGEINQVNNTYPARIEKIADKLCQISEIHLLSIENLIETIPIETKEETHRKVQIS
jgi:hypothetical protein